MSPSRRRHREGVTLRSADEETMRRISQPFRSFLRQEWPFSVISVALCETLFSFLPTPSSPFHSSSVLSVLRETFLKTHYLTLTPGRAMADKREFQAETRVIGPGGLSRIRDVLLRFSTATLQSLHVSVLRSNGWKIFHTFTSFALTGGRNDV
jgi:hypothetical protein